MQLDLILTHDEVAEAARLLRFAVTGQTCIPGFEEFVDPKWADHIRETLLILTCIAQVIDNRKEKEIG